MKNLTGRVLRVAAMLWVTLLLFGTGFRVLANCSAFGLPFTDLGSTGFCAQIAEAYYTGLTNGTTATTYSPAANVSREQMAAFVTRTLDKSLSRGKRRSALQQFWNGGPRWDLGFGLTSVGSSPLLLQSDGTDVWVADSGDGTVYRVRTADGTVVGHWTGASGATGVLVAMGRIFVTGAGIPGALYMIDPTQAPTAVTTVANGLGGNPGGIAFDGTRIWTANVSGSVSIITPGSTTPYSTSNLTTDFSEPTGAIFDGSNVWITDQGDDTLKRLNASGGVLDSVPVGHVPQFPAFDGTNIWVPNISDNSVSVVHAATRTVVAILTGNGLSEPIAAAFDGQRVLVTDLSGGLSIFQATTLAPIGNAATPGVSFDYGACSDGTNFWVAFAGSGKIGRF